MERFVQWFGEHPVRNFWLFLLFAVVFSVAVDALVGGPC